MSERTQRAAGVRSREIDLSGPTAAKPQGVPAAIIGTSRKGRAFVPITFASKQDFDAEFGRSDGEKFGPLAVYEWMKDGNARAGTFVRILGCGDGKQRSTVNGTVNKAGFVVGSQQTQLASGLVGHNVSSNLATAHNDRAQGRTYFLGAWMSEVGSMFSDAGQHAADSDKSEPILRAVLMVPSGVIPTLKNLGYRDAAGNAIIQGSESSLVAANGGAKTIGLKGCGFGEYTDNAFTLLLNGHRATSAFPNSLNASFDPRSSNHLSLKLNRDPTKIEKAGHYLYTFYDVSTTQADVCADSTTIEDAGPATDQTAVAGETGKCFILSGALNPNQFDAASRVPNFENFQDRFATAKSPFVVSQKFGSNVKNLFRMHSLDDGNLSQKVKITIENIQSSNSTYADYGTFDILVRAWIDTDSDRKVLESYRGCNLDPTSENYIARKIGDTDYFYDFDRREGSQKLRVEGSYVTRSSYIRVEMHPDVDAAIAEKQSLPCGFRGAPHLLTRVTDPAKHPTLVPVGGDASDVVSNGANGVAAHRGVDAPAGTAIRRQGTARMGELPVPMREHVKLVGGLPSARFTWGMQFETKPSAAEPNAGRTSSTLMENLVKYFPQDLDRSPAPQVFDNEGTPDADGLVFDCDTYNNNFFSLEKIQVITGSDDLPTKSWEAASYRRGNSKTDLTDIDGKTHAALHTRFLDPAKDFKDSGTRPYLKFSFTLFGGFDGVNIFNREKQKMSDFAVRQELTDPSLAGKSENTVASYRKALDVLTEKSDTDIQLLAIPGLRHPAVTDYAVDAVESRFDAMYVMDLEEMDNDNIVVTGSTVSTEGQLVSVKNTANRLVARNLDTSFAATYFPDVVMNDPSTGTNIVCPPSVAVMGALSLNDRIGHPWFAPAGFTRGALASVTSLSVALNQDNLDLLYGTDINPLRSHPQNPEAGVVVWGQKTLQQASSALDRVNVRRLLIDLRRKVKAVALTFLFEPNREETLSKFSAQVTPILTNIQAQRGVSRFKVQIDTTTTTQADVENNTIRGKIYLQPVKSLEFVELDFVVANQGANI
jgi:phage tail sheath protein FI